MTSTTLASALTASSQSVTLAGGTVTVGSLVAVDSEYLRVLEVYSATMGRVQRGVNGSSASAHDTGADAIIGTPYEFLTGPAIPPPFGPSDDTLTAQGPSVAPSYAGASGGASIFHQATVTLTNDQIKALPTTPVALVAAQGANTMIVPSTVWFYCRNWAVDYDNIGDEARLGITYNGSQKSTFLTFRETVSGQVSNLLVDSASHPAMLAPLISISGTTPSSLGQFMDDPDATNVGMDVYAVNAGSHTGDFTAGDAANEIVVAMAYLVFNTQTGMFS